MLVLFVSLQHVSYKPKQKCSIQSTESMSGHFYIQEGRGLCDYFIGKQHPNSSLHDQVLLLSSLWASDN